MQHLRSKSSKALCRDLCKESNGNESGFTLIEMIIGTAIMVEVMIVGYLLFDVSTKTARVQTDVAEMQQSQRVANYDILRTARMAGRGGVRSQVAITVNDNVDGSTFNIAGNPVVDGTDVLTVRGALSTPIWLLAKDGMQYDSASSNGTIELRSLNAQRIPQDFSLLHQVIDDNLPVPIILATMFEPANYGVVLLTGGSFTPADVNGDGTIDPDEETASITFTTAPGTYNDVYLQMSAGGAFPEDDFEDGPALGWIALLEEYRYYIRDDQDSPTGASPKLSRAQFYPGTNVLFRNDAANGRVDIADNVVDLQVALGLDLNGNGVIDENPGNEGSDEWLFNDAGDVDNDQLWGLGDADAAWASAPLFQLRLNTIVRSERRDNTYTSDYLPTLENHEVDPSPLPADEDQLAERRFRRRIMRSVVDLRNVS